MGSQTSKVSQKNAIVINFAQIIVLISFLCNVLEFQNIGHSQRISPWEVVQARFRKKNTTVINFALSRVSIIFRALTRNFKILAIPNVFAHGKSYKHGFVKKCNGHKLCAKSHFDWFFEHRLGI
ncbi:hypothetical protein BHE74_00050872 [Ensete ventricosum]|nr:hypothetical protein BHE74_00050872 [Ensete ventricosum]